ncbi:hypothetical protein GCM10009720_08800 [Yaniella flava]|uniref:Uncharacterized protein n=1 Tax=Yaniella flava TaxID=287930 RepID=A0ABN2U6L2_9MICC
MRKIPCPEADELLGGHTQWCIETTLTDAYGVYGDPRVETTWGRDNQRLQTVRHPHYGQDAPGLEGDREPCEHYFWEV